MSQVMACSCMSSGNIEANCGMAVARKDKPVMEPYWATKTKGIEFQEELYGKGMRLHNECVAKGKVVGHTCTICNRKKVL